MDTDTGRVTAAQGRGGWASPAVRYGGIAAIAILMIWFIPKLGTLLVLLGLSIVAAYLFLPLHKRLEQRLPKGIAAFVTLAAPIVTVLLGIVFLSPVITRQAMHAAALLPQRLEEWWIALGGFVQRLGFEIDWSPWNAPMTIGPEIFSRGWAIVQKLGENQGYLLVLTPILSFYWLRDREQIYHQLLFLMPVRSRTHISRLLLSIHDRLQLFIRGQALSAFLVGLVTMAGLWLFRVPFAAVGGLVMMVLDLIPTFGPVLATFVIAVMALASEPASILAALGVCLMAQQIESACVVPMVLGDSLELHPAIVMLSILAGGMLAGTLGMLAAIPLYLVFREILKSYTEYHASKACKSGPVSVE